MRTALASLTTVLLTLSVFTGIGTADDANAARTALLQTEEQLLQARGLLGKKQFSEGEQLARSILETRRRLLGESHPEVAEAMDLLGDALLAQKKGAEGVRLIGGSVDMLIETTDETDPRLSSGLLKMGSLLAVAGEFQSAVQPLEDGLRLRIEVQGLRDEKAAQGHSMLSAVFKKLGSPQRMLGSEEFLLAYEEKLHGGESLENLAVAIEAGGDAARGLALHKQARDTRNLPPR